MTRKQTEIEESKAELRKMFPKGSTVYCVLRRVARSGMSRDISPLWIGKLPRSQSAGKCALDVRYPWWHVAKVLGIRAISGGSDAVRINGCGMDMGFHLVYSLAAALYGDGYSLTHRWL